MGNVLAQPQKLQPDIAADLPNVVQKDTLGGGRFLKTLLCVHDEGGLVVVKVYHKRSDSPPLEAYKLQLNQIRSALRDAPCSHLWPWQTWLDTPSAGYLLRQHVASSLYDRLSTRPFLTAIEKRWIAFQLLHAVAQAHEAGVVHGDIKCENVLLTSWGWAFLADFASYKPSHLPADNPADFSFYFDTGGRRRCYIAPERFLSTAAGSGPSPGPSSGAAGAAATTGNAAAAGGASSGNAGLEAGASIGNSAGGGGAGEGGAEVAGSATATAATAAVAGGGGLLLPSGPSIGSRTVGNLTPEMDVYSLGLTLAELFLDGRSVMDLGGALGYKRREWDPAATGPLTGLEPDVKALVLHMIQLDPGARWSARRYLQEWAPALFPPYFHTVLHPFFEGLLPLDPDARLAAVQAVHPTVLAAVQAAVQATEGGPAGRDAHHVTAVTAAVTQAGDGAVQGGSTGGSTAGGTTEAGRKVVGGSGAGGARAAVDGGCWQYRRYRSGRYGSAGQYGWWGQSGGGPGCRA